jgi:hypothetical protein
VTLLVVVTNAGADPADADVDAGFDTDADTDAEADAVVDGEPVALAAGTPAAAASDAALALAVTTVRSAEPVPAAWLTPPVAVHAVVTDIAATAKDVPAAKRSRHLVTDVPGGDCRPCGHRLLRRIAPA